MATSKLSVQLPAIIAMLLATAASPLRAGVIQIIQDETNNAFGITNPGAVFSPANEPGPDANQSYLHDGGPGEFTWVPGLNLNNATVDVSWGANNNHSPDADYFFDPDGAGPELEIALTQNVDQTLLADQVTVAGGLPVEWSGFLTIGSGLTLTTDSVFRVTGTGVTAVPGALATAAWQFTAIPEPSTLMLTLLALAGASCLRMRRRVATVAALVIACLFSGPSSSEAGVVLSGGGLTLISEGGAIGAGNLATSGTAFAQSNIGAGSHSIAGVNDGVFGNASSWISGGVTEATSHGARAYIGIDLGATPIGLGGFAFGRDNPGTFTDRTLSAGNPYVLQYTLVANPTTALGDTGNPVTGFADIGTLDYQSAGGTNFAFPSRRHEYTFNPLFATGLRLLVPDTAIAIDEFEIFAGAVVPEPSTLALLGIGLVGIVARRRRTSAFGAARRGQMAVVALTLALCCVVETAQAITITPDAGFSITYDGNDGDYFDAASPANAPTNLASPSTGSVAFGTPGLGGAHTVAGATDGLYGNSNSWLTSVAATGGGEFIGVDLNRRMKLTSIAFGRDNGNNVEAACGGQCPDRFDGTYTIQYTQVANPGASTLVTGDPETGWDTIGTITYGAGEIGDSAPGGSFTGFFRHEFGLGLNGEAIGATAARIIVSSGSIAIDEVELTGFVPEPSTGLAVVFGSMLLAARRRRK